MVLILKNRWIAAFLLALSILPRIPVRAEQTGPAAMILLEPRTGTVLEALNPDEPMLIASTTKIMTALVVLESCRLQETVTVSQEQVEIEGSSASLCPGESYTVEELLYGLMLASGNDAACVLAEHTAGSLEAFAELMNRKAEALALTNTHFANPHGLDDPAHYASAHDLAKLTAAAMENETFCRIFSTQNYTAHGVSYQNHNKLLENLDGCLGGKTGYTRAAGRTLVSCAERNGFRLICVTLSDPDDWEDHRRAYESAFAAFDYLAFPAESWRQLPVISGTVSTVSLHCALPGAVVHRGAHIETEVFLPRFVFAPLKANEPVGEVRVLENGRTVCETQILTSDPAALYQEEEMLPWKRFFSLWTDRVAVAAHEERVFV